NAFTSVSLDPPLIAICVDLRSQTLSRLRTSGCFAVNVLEASHEALSQCFATPAAERYESFCHVPYHVAVTGSPVLSGVLAFLDARIVAEYPGGDHVIILGQVKALGQGTKRSISMLTRQRTRRGASGELEDRARAASLNCLPKLLCSSTRGGIGIWR